MEFPSPRNGPVFSEINSLPLKFLRLNVWSRITHSEQLRRHAGDFAAIGIRCRPEEVLDTVELDLECPAKIASRKAFWNIAQRCKEETISIIRKFDFRDIQMVHLDRTKGRENRAVAKRFAAKVESALSGFQDSGIILAAFTVRHN